MITAALQSATEADLELTRTLNRHDSREAMHAVVVVVVDS